ncbi:MAG: PHP domain-containing protein [Thermodesulfovibrio sp.]|uniref:PHP domain-containing protein n=1 Tax=unclassified Thermodesulfovibrio TaxID=2645936 RepID=UPI00083AB225|nr:MULTISPECIES: PHP domain-containing protein [unclassified Thermodesulfovibrio]MDI1471104.1 PHP domain-containing protein [Thermodesulfovibrio sp. 1176]MDI6713954.1 PHP domain-containing protein [Thermodesulfovibrio sp.]
MLLCDFHIHTKYSDGSLELKKVVDLFGQAGFDVIAITDHVVNGDSLIGKLAYKFRFTITEKNFNEYLENIEYEAQRAWNKYEMLVIPGVEISKNYLSSDKSAHILILDIKNFIPACGSYESIFLEAKKQNALVVACHPHHMKGEIRNTLYLWKNKQKYGKYIDAWEIANRDDVFNVVSLKKYPYIANSDFHKARHLYSWKTLLNCEKDKETIKTCIKHNKGVAITLFRR